MPTSTFSNLKQLLESSQEFHNAGQEDRPNFRINENDGYTHVEDFINQIMNQMRLPKAPNWRPIQHALGSTFISSHLSSWLNINSNFIQIKTCPIQMILAVKHRLFSSALFSYDIITVLCAYIFKEVYFCGQLLHQLNPCTHLPLKYTKCEQQDEEKLKVINSAN